MTPDKKIALSEAQKARVIWNAKQHHYERLVRINELHSGAVSEDELEEAEAQAKCAKLDVDIADAKVEKLP